MPSRCLGNVGASVPGLPVARRATLRRPRPGNGPSPQAWRCALCNCRPTCGRRVGTITFDSREALAASRDAIARIREVGVKESASTVDEVAEMELAFAHLHVPEMA